MKKILLSVEGDGKNYINALEKEGSKCVIYNENVNLNNFDALVLCGGCDVAPEFYGEELNGSEKVSVVRDLIEFYLINRFLSENKPILAVCRGFQILNVYLGGTLIQDIKNNEIHRSDNGVDLYHIVKANKGSVLNNCYGNEFVVNSYHHQAIKKLSPKLKATCYSIDGIIEGYENLDLNIIGVQFHPERLFGDNGAVYGGKIINTFLNL